MTVSSQCFGFLFPIYITNIWFIRRSYLMHDKRVEFSELAALARLGHKYQLDNILTR